MGFFQRLFGLRKTSSGTLVPAPRRPFFSRGNTVVNEDTSMQVAAFSRGVVYISSQIAKLPWEIKDVNNKIVDNNPISFLLNVAPNSEMNAFKFKLCMVQQAIIHGNFYAEIERDTIGRPIALWPLRSSGMWVTRSQEGRLEYIYMNPDGSGRAVLDPYDVFHIPNFHTKDGIIGQGVTSYARDVLGICVAADNMAGGIFENAGIPSGILKHPGRLSDDAYKRLKDSWAEQTGGRKAGATSVLEEGITYEAINMDPEALQFIQSRQFGVLEIARFLGVPPTKLFDIAGAKFSNVENANLEVVTDTLHSWAINLEMECDVKLLNNRYGGRYSDIDLYSIFRGDMATRAEYYNKMMGIGALTPNQIREREGLAGYAEGDNYYIATNNFTPVNRMNEVIDAEIAQKTKPVAAPAAPATKSDKTQALQDAAIKYLTKK